MIKRLIIIEIILLSISNEVHHSLIIHDGRQLCAMSYYIVYNSTKWLIVLFVIWTEKYTNVRTNVHHSVLFNNCYQFNITTSARSVRQPYFLSIFGLFLMAFNVTFTLMPYSIYKGLQELIIIYVFVGYMLMVEQ